MSPTDRDFYFEGFRAPQYTQPPNELFEYLAPRLSESALRVLPYVVRRTFGFHKNADAISVSQLAPGITNADGEQLDYGTGMSTSAIWRGTKGLIEKDILKVDRIKNADGAYETNAYSLRFSEETSVSLQESRQNKAV